MAKSIKKKDEIREYLTPILKEMTDEQFLIPGAGLNHIGKKLREKFPNMMDPTRARIAYNVINKERQKRKLPFIKRKKKKGIKQ